MKKFKKVLFLIASFFTFLINKVYAMIEVPPVVALYGIEPIEQPTFVVRLLEILKLLLIPAVLLVGIIVFIIKKRKNKKKDDNNSSKK